MIKRLFMVLGILMIAAILLLTGYIVYENRNVKHTVYTVTSNRLPPQFDGTKIALITDFHNTAQDDKILDAVRDSSPDFICIVGDLVSMKTTDYNNVKHFVKSLTQISQVYYSYGNHEYYNASYRNEETPGFEKLFRGMDVIFMNDSICTIEKDGAIINLVGYKDSIHGDMDGAFMQHAAPFLDRVTKGMDPSVFSVLMLHRAQYFDEVSEYPFDLVISGHLHGGEVNLPYINSWILKRRFGSDKYVKGIYTDNQSTMVVSAGCSSDHVFRVFNTPEVVTVVLECE